MNYKIYDGEQIVGEARIDRQGMFWQIRCICKPLDGKPPRVFVKWDKGTTSLGRCVPDGDEMTLLKRVPMNKLDLNRIRFGVATEQQNLIPVDAGASLASVADLKKARLRIQAGQHYLELADSSSPTGQWSEPKISE